MDAPQHPVLRRRAAVLGVEPRRAGALLQRDDARAQLAIELGQLLQRTHHLHARVRLRLAADEGAAPLLGREQALGLQQLHRLPYGDRGDAELPLELGQRRDASADRPGALHDALAHHVGDLGVERARAALEESGHESSWIPVRGSPALTI